MRGNLDDGDSMSNAPLFHLVSTGPRPVGPFSHATEIDGWVFVTGQMPTDPAAPDAPLPVGVEAQTRRVMENLQIVLGGIGLGFEHVLQARIYLTEFERDFAPMNGIYKTYFTPGRLPARTCIGVTSLAVGALVEIDLLVKRPS
jgi:2-iminobutanoate/2-iminopropanoate deaminase